MQVRYDARLPPPSGSLVARSNEEHLTEEFPKPRTHVTALMPASLVPGGAEAAASELVNAIWHRFQATREI